jgi:hypothetical protein
MEHKIIRKIEEQVTRQLLLTAKEAGWPCIGYDNGDGFEKDSDYESILDMCLNVDEITLVFLSPDKKKRAAVFLVYGNDGWDLISDNTIVEGFEELVMEKMTDYCENIEQHLFTA